MNWKQWSRKARALLWIITLVGVIAAIPLGIMRVQMERSANTVEYVFDYRDLQEVANYQSDVQAFLDEKLRALKEAGVQTMSLYESSLRDLVLAGRLYYFTEREIANLQGELVDRSKNYTYVIFKDQQTAEQIAPIIKREFTRQGVELADWTYEDKPALIIKEISSSAVLKTFDFDL